MLIVSTIFISACNSSSKITDAIVDAHNQDLVYKAKQVEIVINNYFVAGENITNALNRLISDGFEIHEFSIEGYKKYPNGEFKPYAHTPDSTERIVSEFGRVYKYVAKRFQGLGLFSNAAIVMIKTDLTGTKVKEVSATVSDS